MNKVTVTIPSSVPPVSVQFGAVQGGGTSDYNRLRNKPTLNGVEIIGDKTSEDYGIAGDSLPTGGTDGQYLVKDSAEESGARWADLPTYGGVWSVTPLVNTQTTLETAQTYLDRDVVVEAIPYAEVSNLTGGLTATIGG